MTEGLDVLADMTEAENIPNLYQVFKSMPSY
jgi:hypothetical protein